jgi:hypothetical protein
MKETTRRPSVRAIVSPSYHLYYRLPWHNAAVGLRHNSRYEVLRSDTEKIVAYCNTQAEAEKICKTNADLTGNQKPEKEVGL